MKKLLIASHNEGKIKEIQQILAPYYDTFVTPNMLGIAAEVEEDGDTFYANAKKKAMHFKDMANLDVIADDSGLCVDALGGKPGVYSARFAGENSTDAENNKKLLLELINVPTEKRHAQFVCCIVLVTAENAVYSAEGKSEGIILEAPRGEGGFGYDPLFWNQQFQKTYAELSAKQKNSISHRSQALEKLQVLLGEADE